MNMFKKSICSAIALLLFAFFSMTASAATKTVKFQRALYWTSLGANRTVDQVIDLMKAMNATEVHLWLNELVLPPQPIEECRPFFYGKFDETQKYWDRDKNELENFTRDLLSRGVKVVFTT